MFSVPSGARPTKPENAEGIGFSGFLWKLVQKCWDGEVAQRPQIQEVVEGIGKVAASWFTSMPPSDMQRVVSDVEDDEDEGEDGVSYELKHGKFLPFPIVPSRLSPSAQLQCLNYIRVTILRLPTGAPTLRNLVIYLPSPPQIPSAAMSLSKTCWVLWNDPNPSHFLEQGVWGKRPLHFLSSTKPGF